MMMTTKTKETKNPKPQNPKSKDSILLHLKG
jgi:hypothetical protein